MKIKYMAITLLSVLCWLGSAQSSRAQEVVVTVKNLKSTKGNIRMGVFTSEENFSNKKYYKMLTFPKAKVTNGTMTLRIKLPAGTYGLSMLDDENANDKMDYNMIHIPKEGFGFSDYVHSGLSMPKFNSFKFSLAEEETKKVTMQVKYM